MRVFCMAHLWLPRHCAGAEVMSNELLKALVKRGHQVTVQLSMPHPMFTSGPYMHEGVAVYPYVDQRDPLRWMEHPDGKPDLIITYLMNTLRASYLAQQYNIPVVTIMHNDHLKSRHDLKHGTQLVVYNTHWMRQAVEEWYRDYLGEPPRGIVVHPPIFPADYKTKPGSHITLINLFEEKGSAIFYKLAEAFPKLRFLGVTGAYGKQDVRHGLPNVDIVPHVAAHHMKTEVYAKTRVLLMPSWYESYGRAAVEAACSGIPTIASPTAGLREALGDGGTFAEHDDVNAWTAALAGLTTAKGWAEASAKAKSVAARQAPAEDLERWADAAEQTARLPTYV